MDPDLEPSTWRTIRLAVALVWRSGRNHLTVIGVATVITSISVAGQLLVGRSVLDLLADNERVDGGELAPHLVALGVLLMVAALSQAVAGDLRVLLGEQVARRTTDDILDVATEVELEAYEHPDFHNRLERARAAAAGQSSAVVFGLVTTASTMIVALGVVGVLIAVAPILVPVALLGYLPIAYVNVRNNRARYNMERDLTEVQRERLYLEYVLSDRVEAQEIRAYDIAPTLRRWHAGYWDVRMAQLRGLVRRRLTLTTLGSAVTTAVLIATLAIALILAGRGSISLGDAAVAVVGLQQLNGRLQSAATAFANVHEGVTFLRDFDHFRATLPEIRHRRPTGVPPVNPAVLTAEGLGYRYPGATDDALGSVGFELRRGQVMAVVGANGSGKSTLAKLVCGLLPPTRGTIRWDGADLAECDPRLVRRRVAPVFQDYARYMLTIRQSIGLGDVDRMGDETAIRQAAELTGVTEVIERHREGLDVRLGKSFTDGVDISIGEWQRLAIARALFRDAPLVVLDEPSASLDPHAEAELFELLRTLCDDRIVVFVSHRFATVRSADVVLVLDEGDVVELGSHEDLMARGGLYADLFEIQATRFGR